MSAATEMIEAARADQLWSLARASCDEDPANVPQQPGTVAFGQPHMVIMWRIRNCPNNQIERINPRGRLSSMLSRWEERTGPRSDPLDGGSDLAQAATIGRCHN
jgi:hypothetical protein